MFTITILGECQHSFHFEIFRTLPASGTWEGCVSHGTLVQGLAITMSSKRKPSAIRPINKILVELLLFHSQVVPRMVDARGSAFTTFDWGDYWLMISGSSDRRDFLRSIDRADEVWPSFRRYTYLECTTCTSKLSKIIPGANQLLATLISYPIYRLHLATFRSCSHRLLIVSDVPNQQLEQVVLNQVLLAWRRW